jgi:enterochelin esterase-like enzyme
MRQAVGALISLGIIAFASSVSAQTPGAAGGAAPATAGRGGGRGAAAVTSPEISADRRVTFRLRAPNAREVSVTGLAAPLPMRKDDQGVWSATTEPLAPDIFEYRFSVDGATFPDPGNLPPLGTSSLLSVPGALWTTTTPDVPAGTVARHSYRSPLMGGTEEYYVYTPPGYDMHRRQPYPVLFILHGLGDQAYSWIGRGGANVTLDNLIAQGKAVPMILVSPHGQGSGNAAASFPNFTRALLEEITPQVEREYHVSRLRTDRAVTGLSMGAAQSLLLLNHLDQFAWIGSFSPGFDMYASTWGGGRARGAAPAAAGQPPGRRGGTPPAGAGAPPAGAAADVTAQPAGRGTAPDGAAPAGGPGRQRPVLEDGVLAQMFPALDAKANNQLKLLYVVCGTADDHLELTRQFRDFLAARKVTVNYVEVPDEGHVWPLWRQQLGEMAQMVFKPAGPAR